MPTWVETAVTARVLAELSLLGMGFDVLGGCYLAYDLLGGKRGPLRTIARTAGYIALFFAGYALVLGLRYGMVAASGMGILLAIEFRLAATNEGQNNRRRSTATLFGFLRGAVLGLAGMSIVGPTFGVFFGVLSGVGLVGVYSLGFAPTDDYELQLRPRLSRHKILASALRAVAVGLAGLISAGLLMPSSSHWVFFGLKLGLAAGAVSALVGLFSPLIEWWIDNLPEKRLGALGLSAIVLGMLLQSVQYWVVVLNVHVR